MDSVFGVSLRTLAPASAVDKDDENTALGPMEGLHQPQRLPIPQSPNHESGQKLSKASCVSALPNNIKVRPSDPCAARSADYVPKVSFQDSLSDQSFNYFVAPLSRKHGIDYDLDYGPMQCDDGSSTTHLASLDGAKLCTSPNAPGAEFPSTLALSETIIDRGMTIATADAFTTHFTSSAEQELRDTQHHGQPTIPPSGPRSRPIVLPELVRLSPVALQLTY